VRRFWKFPLVYGNTVLLIGGGLLYSLIVVGCADVHGHQRQSRSNPYSISDTRRPISLSAMAVKEHRTAMLLHLETIQAIVNALVEEDYELARSLTGSHLGFFMHRQVMAKQDPYNFPPRYHDLAIVHYEAAEELARVIPTRDLKRILPSFNDVLKACVACHRQYKLDGGS
jgi:hypothetical protein